MDATESVTVNSKKDNESDHSILPSLFAKHAVRNCIETFSKTAIVSYQCHIGMKKLTNTFLPSVMNVSRIHSPIHRGMSSFVGCHVPRLRSRSTLDSLIMCIPDVLQLIVNADALLVQWRAVINEGDYLDINFRPSNYNAIRLIMERRNPISNDQLEDPTTYAIASCVRKARSFSKYFGTLSHQLSTTWRNQNNSSRSDRLCSKKSLFCKGSGKHSSTMSHIVSISSARRFL